MDTAEIFYEIRDIYDEKRGVNKETEDLIRSQSSSSVFVYRRKTRDVGSNIIDNWILSSFEERTFSMEIAPSFIEISPVTVDLDDDITRLLSITDAEYPMLNSTDLELAMSAFTNFLIPESVMTYIKENCYDITSLPTFFLMPETFTSFNYVVLLLALLGLSILLYMIYRIVVWRFMLDQNKEHDLSVNTYSEAGSPINMESYNTCLFPPGFDDEPK